jgi:hypothetical protein
MHKQTGQCSNQISVKFWEVVCDEHGIDGGGEYAAIARGLGRQVRAPRGAVPMDLEPGVIGAVRASPFGERLVNQNEGAGSNWAKGHYTTNTRAGSKFG